MRDSYHISIASFLFFLFLPYHAQLFEMGACMCVCLWGLINYRNNNIGADANYGNRPLGRQR